MSYINDALKRAQKERDSRYASYGPILQPSTDRGSSRKKRNLVAIAAAVLVLLAGGTALIFFAGDFTSPTVPREAKQFSARAAQRRIPGPQAVETNAGRAALLVVPKDTPPFDSESMYARALEKQKGHRLYEAEALYRKILERDPGHVQSLNNLGVIYLGQGRMNLAATTFRKALAVRKDYVDPYYNLACLCVQIHDLRAGLQYLRQAAAVDTRVKSWAREDADLRPLQELPEYRSFLSESYESPPPLPDPARQGKGN